ncbi:uncharacterized protein EI97DRAFT_170873 [Westerdykella ornata]|uniref:ABC transmembrane type-1 domain-containing protein n=1 Tax=Westerdykella ornata TaxID=318751 RepID=A0A6A6JS90_WESOR|nr:uncharacterized protein EI97DRAFT_170873 [Westerdykella ornata]KAF2279257.1 hypothetical protein EI97DRAFT_170873 [Westerdykella ornata]
MDSSNSGRDTGRSEATESNVARPKGAKNASTEAKETQSSGAYFRVFRYATRATWALNVVAFIAAIASGTLLPLMDFVFGKFVTAFTNFATGVITPAEYRVEINTFALYFIYLFIAKFCLVYIHSALISVAAIRTTKALRIAFLEQTLRQNVAFFDSPDAGSVTTQATTNANNVNNGISEKLTLTLQGISTFGFI